MAEVALQEGKITFRQLSAWFGMKTPDGFARTKGKNREKKLKTLAAFADYHFEGKTLYIDKVLCPYYNKAYDIIEEELPKRWGLVKNEKNEVNVNFKKKRIDTCSRVGTEIYLQVPGVKSQISLETSKVYASRVKVIQYGRNHKDEYGIKGYSQYVWLNKDLTDILSGEEAEIFEQCQKEAYGDVSLRMVPIDDDYRRGQITKEEYIAAKGQVESLSSYDYLVELCVKRLGFFPDKRTQLVDVRQFGE